jgi:N-6 DNA Methylase
MERAAADAVRELDAAGLFAALGYPIEPVEIDAEQWRRIGIEVPLSSSLTLLLRQGHVDFLLLSGELIEIAEVAKFATSLRKRNALAISVIAVESSVSSELILLSLGHSGKSRLMRVDLRDRTALSRLDALRSPGTGGDLERVIDRAFDRELLTSRFFVGFRRAVYLASEEIAGQFPIEAPDAIAAEALLMMSRLLFIYFIQEKGWLDGNRAFVSKSLDRACAAKRDFYRQVLEPLFFGCLNTSRAERQPAALLLGEIPYLNGGLFEPSQFEVRNPALSLSQECCRFAIEEVFERFTFSINERGDEGLHVDPEMLGKVFESLMAEDERAITGSFYTPKVIVDALTRRALLAWLAAGDEALAVSLERLLAGENLIGCTAALGLLRRLESVTVLDPACGSGAFLLAALILIESLIVRLSQIAAVGIPGGLRQRIVETSLFGVDLKREAVRLCELRLWLAIVSPQQLEIREVRPLPNLDRNVLQGNSLLGPMDFLGSGALDVYRSWLAALRGQSAMVARYRHAPGAQRPELYRQIRENDERLAADLLQHSLDRDEAEVRLLMAPAPDLFGRASATNTGRLDQLRERMGEAQRELKRIGSGEVDFFAFDVHFAGVMAAGGFDIVVGNPPWVRNSRITPEARRRYRDRYAFFRGGKNDGNGGNQPPVADRGFNQPDLAVAFYEKALSLARPDGVVAMLVPSKVATSAYGTAMRAAVERESLVAVEDWGGEAKKWFDADTFPLGLTIRRNASQSGSVALRVDGRTYAVNRRVLSRSVHGSPWSLIPPDCAEIVERLDRDIPSLEQSLGRQPIMGVKTGRNSSFFLEIEHRNGKLIDVRSGAVVPAAALARCIRGRDLKAWTIVRSNWMLWPPAEGWSQPPRWLEQVAEVRGLDPAECRLAFVRPQHAGIKVVWKDLSRQLSAAVVPRFESIDGQQFCLVPNQTLYCLSAQTLDEAHVLSAIFNSVVFAALALSRADRAKDRHYRYFARTVAAVPLPEVKRGSVEWLRLGQLSQRAHRGDDVSNEIDHAASALYGLAAVELDRLRAFVRQRLGA